MYYIVSLLDEYGGLEELSPYVYLERSGEVQGYVEYSPYNTPFKPFKYYELALVEAYEIYKTVLSSQENKHIEFARGLYILDLKNNKLSDDLTTYFRSGGIEQIKDPRVTKGEINV